LSCSVGFLCWLSRNEEPNASISSQQHVQKRQRNLDGESYCHGEDLISRSPLNIENDGILQLWQIRTSFHFVSELCKYQNQVHEPNYEDFGATFNIHESSLHMFPLSRPEQMLIVFLAGRSAFSWAVSPELWVDISLN
jgi:hypothetical protein